MIRVSIGIRGQRREEGVSRYPLNECHQCHHNCAPYTHAITIVPS
jgi:hypothetical protein